MSKWNMFVALVLIFNVLMSVGYVLASNYLMDYFRTQLTVEKGLSVFHDNLFHIEIFHPFISDGHLTYPPTPLNYGIWNYPYILFLVGMLGNLGFMGVAFVLWKKDSERKGIL